MNLYLITYDLSAPGRNYENLFDGIKKVSNDWAHPLESVWIVETSLSAGQIRDHLTSHIDKNDKLIVLRLGKEAAWYGLSDETSNWIRRVFPKSGI